MEPVVSKDYLQIKRPKEFVFVENIAEMLHKGDVFKPTFDDVMKTLLESPKEWYAVYDEGLMDGFLNEKPRAFKLQKGSKALKAC